ncbi:MAG TPA: winged helix-turn-helix domain-containing protein [Paracoccaceae bacterium]|nr:winged helix-turn-helix domain-containing protein [Paracoccaceae bacterium]HMO70708.1 winged helix-turn-helix domain-containing protein [Paracoccaceae bacterium]
MLLRFGDFTLDTGRAELRGPDGPVHLEPKPLALLTFLAENNDRVLTRDAMIDAVWGGRIVSDAAVSTVLKQVRKALADGGRKQEFIRTLHGRGHRFVAEVRIAAAASVAAGRDRASPTDGRPMVAVLPFRSSGRAGRWANLPEAIAAEVIASLSRLRWLRVIARETTFRFRNPSLDVAGVRDILGAGYALCGVVDTTGARLAVSLELSETAGGSVIWAERFTSALDAVHAVRTSIVDCVLAALEISVPRHEAEIARLRPSESLDAWSAFHLGLAHVYRFNRNDNAIAAGLFRRATELDREFAAAWAARSFSSFQDAFMGFLPDRAAAVREAQATAERSIELDPMEPTANFAMGRLPILTGDLRGDTAWLDRALELSPSFAKGHYSRALVNVLAGRTEATREGIDRAMQLSPLDPLLGPMFGVRALSLLIDGHPDAAQEQAQKALRAGPSHLINAMTAAAISALCGKAGEAAQLRAWVGERRPDATVGLYLSALPMVDGPTRQQLIRALLGLGFPR